MVGPDRPQHSTATRHFTRRFGALGVNVPALLFGPFYFLARGLWRKGATLLVVKVAGDVAVLVYPCGSVGALGKVAASPGGQKAVQAAGLRRSEALANWLGTLLHFRFVSVASQRLVFTVT